MKDISSLKVETFALGPMEANAYVVFDPEEGHGLVIDPGDRDEEFLTHLKTLPVREWQIFLTHGHADHIAGTEWLRKALPALVSCSIEDAPMLSDAGLNLSQWLGLPYAGTAPDRLLKDGDHILIGSISGRCLSLPGHTTGGMALVFSGMVFSGDVLFAGSVGRSDFPGGNSQELMRSIHDRLLTLGEARVYPGHGPATSLATERQHNPFLSGNPIGDD